MKERPILFSGPMVRALLDGSKTQTRRIVKGKALEWLECFNFTPEFVALPDNAMCPYGQPGDRLWVREAWSTHISEDRIPPRDCSRDVRFYEADHGAQRGSNPRIGKLRPSIHMPRWHSRITVEITEVRVERLQDISEADAEAEGCESLETERYERDWKLCPKCGGTRLHNALGGNGGVIFDADCYECDTYVKRYRHLWNAINGSEAWDANPWVWAVTFRRLP